jgi:serine/threonine protein kinase
VLPSEPGRLFAERYEIRRRLGRGAMGEVYEAVAHSPSGFARRVALKCLHPEHASSPKELDALREEARIASRLHHGSIVDVIDFGIVAGTPFLVLELVDGMSAASAIVVTRGLGQEVPLGAALTIVIDAARALHYAHELTDDTGRPLHIVHRDVKPSNILLSWAGDVKLVDFGIAITDDRIRDTTIGFAKGTRGYMSPEQLIRGPIDPRSDVFALGCTLHALLAGDSPARSDAAIARLVAQQSLELARGVVPDDVLAVVARAVAPRPSDRHPSALAFAEDAARVLASRRHADGRGLVSAWLDRIRDARDHALRPPVASAREGPATLSIPTPMPVGPVGVPDAPRPTLTAASVLARVPGTDTFASADTEKQLAGPSVEPPPQANASVRPAPVSSDAVRGSSRSRSTVPPRARTFGVAVIATVVVGLTFVLGAVSALVLGREGPFEPRAPGAALSSELPAAALVDAGARGDPTAAAVDAAGGAAVRRR